MRSNIIHSLAMLMLVGALASCNDDTFGPNGSQEENRRPIVLSGEIEQVAVTRVNDNGFCDGDEMGVYIVDYQGSTPGTLQNSGNRGNNVKHTFDEAAYKWNSASTSIGKMIIRTSIFMVTTPSARPRMSMPMLSK